MESADAASASLKEQAATAVAVLYGKHGYVDDEGERDAVALAISLYPTVSTAEAHVLGDRSKACIRRRQLVETAFPGLPGPEAFSEQENPDLAKEVYTRINSDVWRLTSIGPNGYLQSRLNSGLGLVLCRTKVNPDAVDAVYVTRSRACILEDIFTPIAAAQKRQSDRQTAVTEMVMDRVPEDAKRFQNQFLGGMKGALESATSSTNAALARAEAKSDEGDVPVEADDESVDE